MNQKSGTSELLSSGTKFLRVEDKSKDGIERVELDDIVQIPKSIQVHLGPWYSTFCFSAVTQQGFYHTLTSKCILFITEGCVSPQPTFNPTTGNINPKEEIFMFKRKKVIWTFTSLWNSIHTLVLPIHFSVLSDDLIQSTKLKEADSH